MRWSTPVISPLLSVSRTPLPVILSAMKRILLFSNPWNSQNRLFVLLSSLRLRPVRKKWVSPL
ncbi:hypothetical protein EVA_18767 [gut metagenome]|uniref:Uncharacterized protein n=1 Tax=gut metagenome TaxID=749906 RepID=J9FU88_9ZZZZ